MKKARSAVKGLRIRQALRKLSETTRSRELQEASSSSGAKVTLTRKTPGLALNKSGDRRGMHMVESPPDPETMRKIRAARKFYGKKMPVLQCANCQFSQQCPQFRAGYECAFLPLLDSHGIQDTEDLVFYMKELLGANMRRTQLQLLMETLTGAKPSLEVSEALNLAFMQLTKLHEMTSSSDSLSVEINDGKGTIIGQLFGSLGTLVETTKQSKANPINVQSVVERVQEAQEGNKDLTKPDSGVNQEALLAFKTESAAKASPLDLDSPALSKARRIAEAIARQ